MVGVGGGVCEAVGMGVEVRRVASNGRQATRRDVIARSREAATKQSPNGRADCPFAPRTHLPDLLSCTCRCSAKCIRKFSKSRVVPGSAGVVGPGLDTRFALLDHRPLRSDNTCKSLIKKY
jgi:hypothetical protein